MKNYNKNMHYEIEEEVRINITFKTNSRIFITPDALGNKKNRRQTRSLKAHIQKKKSIFLLQMITTIIITL